jgi:4-hydroxybenzoate polyprenyltransferase
VGLLAGAAPIAALRLGLAMTALQLGIGALNDVVDAPRDAGRKPGKPIPHGLVSRPFGATIAICSWAAGLVLAVSSGPAAGALAVLVIAIGLAYDLRLKGTAWSWLPFAVGIPILPVFGWVGATGGLSPVFAVLAPVAVAAGAALAIANSLVDVDRDRAAGISSVAVALGEGSARAVAATLLIGVAGAATLSAWVLSTDPLETVVVGGLASLPVIGARAAADPARREFAWRAQALGLGVLAIVWFRAVLR